MTRIANVGKAGYYPTDEPVTEIISTWISAPDGGRLIDPCAGTGEALIPLAVNHNLVPFGIELEEDRARKLKINVDKVIKARPDADKIGHRFVISGSFYSLETRHSRDTFNVAYVNPPYLNTENGRAEYAWLRDTRPLIMPGGLLIWVVPRHILYSEKTAPYLCSWFDDIEIRRFPDPFYDRFKQVIVFGTRREKSIKPDRQEILKIKALGQPIQAEDIQPLDVCSEPYVLPALSEKSKTAAFRSVHIIPTEVVAEHHESGIFASKDIQDIFDPPAKIVRQLRPLMPMKIGHLIGVIAAGFLNNHILDRGNERLLIKGHAHKKKAHLEVTTPAPKGEEHSHTVTFTDTDKVSTSITTMNGFGEFKIYEDADMQEFLADWLPSITTAITEQYPPLYNFDFNGYESAINKLNLGRMIPIVNRPGLLPTQKHVVAAIATRLETEKDALIDGEMGTGKTIMGAAVPAVMAAKGFPMKHMLVLCPPHLVDKWQREIKHVWPRAETMPITSREDVDKFFNHPGPMVGVMKETVARAGSGWLHAFNYLGSMVTKPRAAKKKMHILQSGQFVNGSAKEVPEYLQPLLKEHKEKRYVSCSVCGTPATDKEGVPLHPGAFASAKMTCKQCNQPMYMDGRRRTDNQRLTQFGTYEWRGTHPEVSQYQDSPNEGYAKYPLASYIKRKYKGQLDLLIADECHQYKSPDSDRGYAYHRLAVSAKRILNLTGTSYGGKASTLFSLLYRSSKDMRHAYDYRGDDGLKRWLEDYGIMQEIAEVQFDEHGLESGNSRSKTRVKELPGNSPAILPWLLNRSAFVSLNDLGIALPEYEEIPVGVHMEAEQEEKYLTFEKTLTVELRQRLQRKDKSLLGSYLQALLSLPDTPWRNKRVVDKRKLEATGDLDRATVASVSALPKDHLFPKEREIVNLIKEERADGRRSLLLCQQTATLDITPQWVEMLGNEGIKAEVLKCEPTKREAWVKKAVERGVDVIITHPKRVETGLDLLDFPTIIWMGTEYSVYTILQASRRAWRIGQANKCKVYFFYYYETLQEKAMFLIAAKVKAAIRMRGDTIADDSLADMDALAQDDMVSALTKIMMEGDTGEQVKSNSLEEMFESLNQELKENDGVVGDFDINAIRNDFGSAPEIVEEPITAVIEPTELAQPQITFKKAAIIPTRQGYVAVPIKEKNPDPPVILTSETTVGPEGTKTQLRTHAPGQRLVFGAPNGGMVDVDKVDDYIKPTTSSPTEETVDWSHRDPPKRPKVMIITHDSPAEDIEQFMPTAPLRKPYEENVPADAIKIAMLCIFNLSIAPTAKEALDWLGKDVNGRYDSIAKQVTDDTNTQVKGLALVLQQLKRDAQDAESTGSEHDHNGHSRYCRLLKHLGQPMPEPPSLLSLFEKVLGALSDRKRPHTVRKALVEVKDSLYFAVDQMLMGGGGVGIKDFNYACTQINEQTIRDEADEKFNGIKLNPNTNDRLYRLLKDNGHSIPPYLHANKPAYMPTPKKEQLIFGQSFMPEKPKSKKKKEVTAVQQLAMF